MVAEGDALRVSTFEVDATPEIGDPIAYGTMEAVDDPLSCRGIALLSNEAPIVLAAVDWIGNYNSAHELWRNALADAAGTSPERVAVHTVHQHEAPGFNLDAEQLKLAHGITEYRINPSFARRTIQNAADALAKAVADPTPVTHLGIGTAEVEQIASNRQVLGEDGTCCYVRYTSGGSDFEFASQAPEGVIDPELTILSLWDGDDPIVNLSYYATHPQSYYRNGRVTCDFPGIARNDHEAETGVFQVHFTGAAGNVTAGKYNDGSKELRPELAGRVREGMEAAWSATEREPIGSDDVEWAVRRSEFPPELDKDLDELLTDLQGDPEDGPASNAAWLRRCELGHEIIFPRLRIGNADIIHLPGEPHVEYQLAAKAMQPDRTTAVAGYGNGGPGYLPTRAAFPMGGYEVESAKVTPEIEDIMIGNIQKLLGVDEIPKTPSEFTAEKPRTSR